MRTGENVEKMLWLAAAMAIVVAMGCDSIDIDIDNESGTVNTTVDGCTSEAATPLYDMNQSGVVATCDDHLPCTIDIQCTPCSAVPESIRYVKATCTPDNLLSPFCFDGYDITTRLLLYTGCTHFIADPTPPGVINACFPVKYPADPNSEVHPGICNAFGVCVEQ